MVTCKNLTHTSSDLHLTTLLHFAQNAKKIAQSLIIIRIALGETGQSDIGLIAKNAAVLGLGSKNQDQYIVRLFQAVFNLAKFAKIKSQLKNFIQTDVLMMALKNIEHLVNLVFWRDLKLTRRQYTKQNLRKDHLPQKILYLAYSIMRLRENNILGLILILFIYWTSMKNNQVTARLAE